MAAEGGCGAAMDPSGGDSVGAQRFPKKPPTTAGVVGAASLAEPARRSNADPGGTPCTASSWGYFEEQREGWCGMHALNNYCGGPYVTRHDCRSAALQVVNRLRCADAREEHLDSQSGFLSIDVINILGAAILGIHVNEGDTSWSTLRADPSGAALINWGNTHWTVLQRGPVGAAQKRWRHTNSIRGNRLSDGRRDFESDAEVFRLLADISQRCGGSVTLHRVVAARMRASDFLEREGRRAMLPADDAAVEEMGGGDGQRVLVGGGDQRLLLAPWPALTQDGEDVSIITLNVDGAGEWRKPPAARIDASRRRDVRNSQATTGRVEALS